MSWSHIAGGALLAVAVTYFLNPDAILGPPAQTVILRIQQGELEGLVQTTDDKFKYLSFRGVPYAAPPVGKLRFQPPQPPGQWGGIHDATRDGNSCLQVKTNNHKMAGLRGRTANWEHFLLFVASAARLLRFVMTETQSEDCLFLNVFTPVVRLPAKDLRPVLVFIHGGGFVRGSSNSHIYGPDYLVERDMVVVSMNYRLGIIGFLATNSSHSMGNMGLKDQVMALRWIQNNIHHFGGDPNRVTLYGESAGSASVHLHVLSRMSRGLFHAGIMSSSSALSLYVMTEDPEVHSEILARNLGADEETIKDPKRRVEYLQSCSETTLHANFHLSSTQEDRQGLVTKLPFGAVVEPCHDNEEHFLCESPQEILRKGEYNSVPLIIGSNTYEGSLIYALDSVDEVLTKLESDTALVPFHLRRQMNENEKVNIGQKIREYYYNRKERSVINSSIELYGDELVSHGIHLATKWHIRHATPSSPVYVYQFTNNAFGFYKFALAIKNMSGPGHADDLGYVFKFHILNYNYIPNVEELHTLRNKMTGVIYNFVHHRNPNSPPEKNSVLDITWPPASEELGEYLEFDNIFSVKTGLLKERMQFWDTLCSQITKDPMYQ